MENQDFKRYNRQIILEEIGFSGQQKLADASVLVVGAGGLGCPLLLYLGGAGVGRIGIIDEDLVEESNLHRQVLFKQDDLGHPKAACASIKLKELNSSVQTDVYTFRLDHSNAMDIIKKYDLVIDGSDNFETRYLVNDTCVVLEKPLVSGSIFRFEGQVSVFNVNGGPNYRDCFPEADPESESCSVSGVIGPLAGIIGSIMAQETIKLICGFGELLSGKLLVLNGLTMDVQQYKIIRKSIANDPTIALNKVDTEPTTQHKQSDPGRDQGVKMIQNEAAGEVSAAKYIGQITEIEISELQKWQRDGIPFQLIDVREAYEFEEFNIGGISIPLYDLQARMDKLPSDKAIVFACSHGIRSMIAARLMHKQTDQQLFTVIIPLIEL
ncbi:thiamine biosynthesis protein (HesA/MoeB/ThiF family protein) [Pedobacter sp. BAL39]|uniref:HesA/MoeB/ThiF family protein n=1 Tax=Pedobacter sp. BAL39 TaxID=391596 RepID=UPI0001559F08|nr:HesA/MoeB/ThiF family protein [Pedobacter sp. BAL39]EDM36780.1 thiamine biosynthesis protein (HesA/MoeB/ThiF family protein) [Pedobacter sp. BAL39]